MRPHRLGAYQPTDHFAWSGWRMRIPGGPVGGQYHGFIGPDSSYGGWPGGRTEISDGEQIHPAGKSLLPREGSSAGPWLHEWGGTAFGEREDHSDYVYRSTAEMRPRPNASGSTNVVPGHQRRRSAGYAVAPGNYRGLGAVMYDGAGSASMFRPYYGGGSMPVRAIGPAYSIPIYSGGPGATTVVAQPPPPSSPLPSPTVSCMPGYGWNPSTHQCMVMGPATISPAPSPVVNAPPGAYLPSQGIVVPGITPGYGPIDSPPEPCPAGYIASGPSGSCMPVGPIPCPTGYVEDSTGQCVVASQPTGGAPAAPSAFSNWLASDTVIPGIENQTVVLLGALGAALLFGGRGRR